MRHYTNDVDAVERLANWTNQELFDFLDDTTQRKLQAEFALDLDDDDRLTAVLSCIGPIHHLFRDRLIGKWESFLERKDLIHQNTQEIINNLNG